MLVSVWMLFTFFSAPLSAQPSESQVSLRVITGNDQGYLVNVAALQTDTALLIDLESMARLLRLSHCNNQGSLVFEESFTKPGSRATFIAGNNFVRVVSKDPDLPKRVIQLSAFPLLRQSKFYLPVEQACRLFDIWLDRDVVYSASSRKITAWLRGKRSAESSAGVGVVRVDEPGHASAKPTSSDSGATMITGIDVESRANGAIITFNVSGSLAAASLLKPDTSGCSYLSLKDASGDLALLKKTYSSGLVRSITPTSFAGGGLQFTISLDNRTFTITSSELQLDKKNNRYQVYVRSSADVEAIRRKEKEAQIAQVLGRDVEKWKLNTIVLDAGHGGKDPGAIGGNGTQEKDVVLNIVHDLGTFIAQKWPDVAVVYTRKDDRFIPLHERGNIANRSGGKLFVSVHCNASQSHTARGSEVYILGAHKTKAALDVAMFENSVIRQEADYQLQYKGFSEEHLIMSSMAQNSFARQSTLLAQDIIKPVDRSASTNGRAVRQAGFMVLWTPSMPSALVEVGYLSNPDEERLLRDRQEQARIAYGIFQGVQAYRSQYESSRIASMER